MFAYLVLALLSWSDLAFSGQTRAAACAELLALDPAIHPEDLNGVAVGKALKSIFRYSQTGFFRRGFTKSEAGAVSFRLKKILGKSFLESQESSLSLQLRQHGFYQEGLSGRQSLEIVSLRNLQRFRKTIHLNESPELQELKRRIEPLELVFQHNSTSLEEVPKMPVISSRVLNAAIDDPSRPAGLNTYPFNSQFMKNDDQVYFFVSPKWKDRPARSSYGGYGDQTFSLDNGYAEKHAWVSSYVMYPRDLKRSMSILDQDPVTKLDPVVEKIISGQDNLLTMDKTANVNEVALVEEAIGRLGHFDFTVSDFRAYFKESILYQMQIEAEKIGYIAVFQKIDAALTANNPWVLWRDYFLKQVYGKVPIAKEADPRIFELKVPLAVPHRMISSCP